MVCASTNTRLNQPQKEAGLPSPPDLEEQAMPAGEGDFTGIPRCLALLLVPQGMLVLGGVRYFFPYAVLYLIVWITVLVRSVRKGEAAHAVKIFSAYCLLSLLMAFCTVVFILYALSSLDTIINYKNINYTYESVFYLLLFFDLAIFLTYAVINFVTVFGKIRCKPPALFAMTALSGFPLAFIVVLSMFLIDMS